MRSISGCLATGARPAEHRAASARERRLYSLGRMTVAVSAVDWLLESDEPGIVAQARRDLLDEPDPEAETRVLEGPKVRSLLAGQRPDGGFGVNVYGKWGGAHWRLVSLVELGVPAGEPRCLAAAGTVLAWLTGRSHRDRIQVIGGLTRRCASQEGNALAVCCRLGLADDPRVRLLAESLVEWQWPDGAGTATRRQPDTGRRSTSRYLRCGACRSTGQRPARRLRERRRSAPQSCSSSTASSVRLRRASRSTSRSPRCTRRRSGTTTSSRRSWCSRGWGSRPTRVRRTASICSRSGGSPTAAGAQAAAGGDRPGRAAAMSRSSTGARGRASC